MQTITSTQKEYLRNAKTVGVTVTVDPIEGEPFTFTEDDIIEGTFKIERNWAHGDVLEIGCADAAELTLTLDNSESQWNQVRWEGARLTVVLNIGGEPLQVGIFTVDERPGKLTTIQLKALDDMARFNRPYNSDLAYPATLEEILMDACAKCNVTLYTYMFDNGDYVVKEKPEGDDITYHQIVAWVAQLAGCNAWIDELGRLRLSWYGDNQSGDLEIGPDDRFLGQYEIAEEDIEITGIVYRTEETDYLVGTSNYALIIEDNPLLQDDFEPVLSALYAKIGGFKYRPYKFVALGYPHLWPGDMITKLVDADGNELTSVITNHVYKLNASEIEARGETETVRGYATGAPFTAAQKRVLQSVAKVEAERQTSKLEQTMLDFNQLMSNALGYYETYHTLPSGAKIRYIHDKPVLEESTIIYKYSAEGFGWTDQGWQGGNPVWHSGIDAAGNMIAKTVSAIGIKAEWMDVDDLSAITGNFTQLTAGDAQAYLDLRAINKSPQISMFAYLPNLATWNILQSSYIAPTMFTLGEDWRGEDDPVSSFAAPARVDLHANKLRFSYKTKPPSGGWDPVTSQWIAGMELGFYPDRIPPVQLDCYGHDMEIKAPKVGITGDLLIQGDTQVDGAIYLPHGGGDRVMINASAGAGRQLFYIFSTGTSASNASSYIQMFGMEDSGSPGQIIFGNNGNPTLRMYSNNNVRFYGDVQIDGAITNATITSSTVNISASRLTSGTVPLARIPTLPENKVPQTYTTYRSFAGGIGISSLPTTSSSPNLWVHPTSQGQVHRTTSSRRYKQDITEYNSKTILEACPVLYRDKGEVSQYGDDARMYLGFIAEDLHDLGLTELVDYIDGQPDSVLYDRISAALLVVIKDQEQRIQALEAKVKEVTV